MMPVQIEIGIAIGIETASDPLSDLDPDEIY